MNDDGLNDAELNAALKFIMKHNRSFQDSIVLLHWNLHTTKKKVKVFFLIGSLTFY